MGTLFLFFKEKEVRVFYYNSNRSYHNHSGQQKADIYPPNKFKIISKKCWFIHVPLATADAGANDETTRSNWCRTKNGWRADPGCSTNCSSLSNWGWACRFVLLRCLLHQHLRDGPSLSSGRGSSEHVSTSARPKKNQNKKWHTRISYIIPPICCCLLYWAQRKDVDWARIVEYIWQRWKKEHTNKTKNIWKLGI